MSDFSLIKQLDAVEPDNKPTKNILYQTYELVVEGKTQQVNIPTRVSEDFEDAVGDLTQKIDRRILRELLRSFRGVRVH